MAVEKWESRFLGGISKRRGKPVLGFPRSDFPTAFSLPIRVFSFRARRLRTQPPVRERVDSLQLPINHPRQLKRVQPVSQPLGVRPRGRDRLARKPARVPTEFAAVFDARHGDSFFVQCVTRQGSFLNRNRSFFQAITARRFRHPWP